MTIYIILIPFQVCGSTLHWVLVLYKLGLWCCPGCTAVAAKTHIRIFCFISSVNSSLELQKHRLTSNSTTYLEHRSRRVCKPL